MLIDRGKHSLRLEYSKCNTENEANLKGWKHPPPYQLKSSYLKKAESNNGPTSTLPFVKVQEQNGKFQSFSLLISKCLELESYVSKRLLCYPCVPAGCQVVSTAADDSVGPSLFTVLEVFISITFLCMLGTTLAFPQTPVRVNKV